MLSNIENLKLVEIIQKNSATRLIMNNRPFHGLVFKLSGKSVYSFKTKNMTLAKGEVLYIPKGESYKVERVSEKSEYVLINFDADVLGAKPTLYSFENYPRINDIYINLQKMWLFDGKVEKYLCYSLFYDILAYVLTNEKPQYSYVKKYSKILNAVEYLHSNIFYCDLKISELHRLCKMSDTYFRKIFKTKFGVTPQEYVTEKRLKQAKNIIASGDYNSISDVAHSVGYSDALYFSKLFSKKYGVCPSEFK